MLLLPVALALSLWALGSGMVLLHVYRAEIFIMAEVRRHGLVMDLILILLWFAAPYLLLGIFSAWTARGIRKMTRHPRAPGWLDGLLGSAVLVAALVMSTLVAMVERPALLAGFFYLKGGWRRWVQLTVEDLCTPAALTRSAVGGAGLLLAAGAMGWWRHAARRTRRIAVGIMVVSTSLVAASALLQGVAPHPARDGRPNVLLVLIDSLRPDRADPASPLALPALRDLARAGVRFSDVRTPVARTYSSVASLLTGLHPLRHGIRTIYPSADRRILPEASLPRLLATAGWQTAAVGGYCATVLRGLDAGYTIQRTPRSEASLMVSAVALAAHPLLPIWMRTPALRALYPQMRTVVEGSLAMDVADEAVSVWRSSEAPFFMTVFFDNAHLPYVPNWPETLAAGDYLGPNRYSITAGSLVEKVRAAESAPGVRGRVEERANALRLYQGALASVDRALGTMLQKLAEDGLAEDTVVIVLGDHGENLLDAGGMLAHGLSLERDRSNAVPLLMRWPGRLQPQVVTTPVSVTDILPTLLDLLGLEIPAGLDGRSQAGRLRGEGGELDAKPRLFLQETGLWFFAREVVAELAPGEEGLVYPDFPDGLLTVESGSPPHVVLAPQHVRAVLRAKHRRLEAGPWALVYRPAGDGAHFSLYRQDQDPWRAQDLAAQEPARLHELMTIFYQEARRLGDSDLLPPAPGVIFSP